MNRQTITTAALVFACVALGFTFGVEATARVAMQQFVGQPIGAVNTEWIQQAGRLRWGGVAAFGLSAVSATALYARAESEA